mmetsp:Transcript_98723/g.318358  ORF Transcript_98723/g.318358 Transcript_98723/m.318358 type:complete len:250 (-) Transcript_98723:427-1176(-)
MRFQCRNLERLTGDTQAQVSRYPPDGCQHCHPRMLQLCLAEPPDVDGERESHGVEAFFLADEAFKRWRNWQERHRCAHLVRAIAFGTHCHPRRACACRRNARRDTAPSAAVLPIRVEPRETIAAEHCLSDRASECEHGQTAIFQLLQLHSFHPCFVLRQEVQTEAVVTCVLDSQALAICDLCDSAQPFKNEDEEEDLTEWSTFPICKFAYTSFVRFHDGRLVAGVWAWDAHKFRHDQADPCEHRYAPML